MKAMKILCEHRRHSLLPSGATGRVTSVSADVDRLLRPKSLEQLSVLERQVKEKLSSNEQIDEEYWEQLLDSIGLFKAKAQLKAGYQVLLDARLQALQQEQVEEARLVRVRMKNLAEDAESPTAGPTPVYSRALDPSPALKAGNEDKGVEVLDESLFLEKAVRPCFTAPRRLGTDPIAGART